MSKSVSTTLDEKDYDALKALAKSDDRNISGQVRHMLRAALALVQTEEELSAMKIRPEFLEDARKFPDGRIPDYALATGDDIKSPNTSRQESLPG